MSASALRLYAALRCSQRVSTCFYVLLLHVVFCISSTSLRNMTSLVFLPNREWFVVGMGHKTLHWTCASACPGMQYTCSRHIMHLKQGCHCRHDLCILYHSRSHQHACACACACKVAHQWCVCVHQGVLLMTPCCKLFMTVDCSRKLGRFSLGAGKKIQVRHLT